MKLEEKLMTKKTVGKCFINLNRLLNVIARNIVNCNK